MKFSGEHIDFRSKNKQEEKEMTRRLVVLAVFTI